MSVHVRTRIDVLGRGGELPRSLGADRFTMPASAADPGAQVVVGTLRIPTWGAGTVSVGPMYELMSGDPAWWDALIAAAAEVRAALSQLTPV